MATQPHKSSGTWEGTRLIYPLIWEQSINDNLDLIWSPFPLDLRWQFLRSKRWTGGLTINAISPISKRSQDFTWRPTLTHTLRYRLNSHLALDWEGSWQAEVRTQSKGKNSYALGDNFGLLWQISPQLALSPRLMAFLEKGDPSGRYLGRTPNQNKNLWYLRVPVGLDFYWTLNQRWEIQSKYQYSGWGYSNGFRFHLIQLELVHYW